MSYEPDEAFFNRVKSKQIWMIKMEYRFVEPFADPQINEIKWVE